MGEIELAFDGLSADGVVVLTNFNEVYLGDERFAPVFAELNRRNAVTEMSGGFNRFSMRREETRKGEMHG